MEKISIVIPTLNEAKYLPKLLSLQATNIEIIVVDGGSHDQTVEIALASGVKLLHTASGRATQMNAGAAIATGDILLFLHADTQLPDDFDCIVRQVLSQAIAGAFQLKIDVNLRGLRLVEWGVNLRSRYCQLPYGDQAIFLRATTFRSLGGFPDLPIMEDFEFVRRLRRAGKIAIAPAAVLTSGRRWQRVGVLRTTLINQLIILAYFLGISPHRIQHWYRFGSKRKLSR